MSTLIVAVAFTKDNGDNPATGLTLGDIDLYLTAVHKMTGARTVVWDGTQNPTAEIDNVGQYLRLYEDADLDTYDYFGGGNYTGATSLDADWVYGVIDEDNAGVWSYATRTLTQAAASVTAAVSGSDITIRRGDTLSAALTGLGSLSGYVSLDFMVKVKKSDADNDSIIWIRKNASGEDDGLLRFNKASATAGDGSITIDDSDDGDIKINLSADRAAELEKRSDLYYDVQMITASAVTTKTDGNADVVEDVTRAVS